MCAIGLQEILELYRLRIQPPAASSYMIAVVAFMKRGHDCLLQLSSKPFVGSSRRTATVAAVDIAEAERHKTRAAIRQEMMRPMCKTS